jgi:beta-glucosidase/6-phospho-beta-glucosidase/beta-galactosidase
LVLPLPEVFGPQDCYSFPADFTLGVAASAVQIEGAIADEGRTPVQFDVYNLDPASAPNFIANENNYLTSKTLNA